MTKDSVFDEVVNNTSNSPLLNAGNATCGEREYINLSIGEPHLALSEDVIEAIAKSMRDGFTKYVSPQGILPLREKIVSKFCSGLNWPITAENVLVGSGVSNLINLLLMSYIEPNDSVILIDPYYFSYKTLLSFYKANVITLPENFTWHDLERIKEPVKLIIVANPSNPTGYIMKKEQIYDLGRYADNTGAIFISDEIYRDFDYENKFVSAINIYPNAVVLVGFSKSYAMTGLRLGAAIAPRNIIKRLAIIQTNVMICVSTPIQFGGIAALDIDISNNVEVCKANRNRFIEVLKGKVRFKNPEGGFYIFFDAGCNEIEFLNKAFNLGNIKLTHGSIFTNSVNHVRLSYCVSKEQAEEAAKSLKMILSQ